VEKRLSEAARSHHASLHFKGGFSKKVIHFKKDVWLSVLFQNFVMPQSGEMEG